MEEKKSQVLKRCNEPCSFPMVQTVVSAKEMPETKMYLFLSHQADCVDAVRDKKPQPKTHIR